MEDVAFTRGPARRPVPRVADALLQWSTGLQTKERRIYAGWLAEVGRIDTLDAAMEQAGFAQVTIKHGGGNFVTHWAVEVANLFVIADGVQTISEMKHTPDRYGIAFGWRQLQDGRGQSVLRFRAYVQELLHVGFHEPLLVTVKSTLTGDALNGLMRQYEVLDAVDALRKQQGKPALQPPFYACSIPLGPGAEVSRGSAQTKEITPIVAHIPTPVTREYVLAHWIRREWAALIEAQMDQTIAWSTANSRQIVAGEDQQAPAPDEEAAPVANPRPAAIRANGA
ncbi:MAG: hypothetical protein SH847_24610 [Roseiflexaceae bacterium]|nr:hypothetical protein [Roseiflexaceae bacterium]